jgi:hypothetical protein
VSKETNIAELKRKVEDFTVIIQELEHNIGYDKLLKFWKEEVQALDDTWQFIPEEDGKKRMEARATKMAYMHLFSILDYLRADIENTNKIIGELEEQE